MTNLILTVAGAVAVVIATAAIAVAGYLTEAGGVIPPTCQGNEVLIGRGPDYSAPFVCVDIDSL